MIGINSCGCFNHDLSMRAVIYACTEAKHTCGLPPSVAVMILRRVSSLTSSEPFSRPWRNSWVVGTSDASSQTTVKDEGSAEDDMGANQSPNKSQNAGQC